MTSPHIHCVSGLPLPLCLYLSFYFLLKGDNLVVNPPQGRRSCNDVRKLQEDDTVILRQSNL